MEKCKKCRSYGLWQMIVSGRPYSSSGEIPCNTCKWFTEKLDRFESKDDGEYENEVYNNGVSNMDKFK